MQAFFSPRKEGDLFSINGHRTNNGLDSTLFFIMFLTTWAQIPQVDLIIDFIIALSIYIYLFVCPHLHFFYTRCIGEIASLSNHPPTLIYVSGRGHSKQKGGLLTGQSYELPNSKRT